MNLAIGANIRVTVIKVHEAGLDVKFDGFTGIVRIIDLDWDTHGLLEKMYATYKPSDQIEVKVTAVNGNRFLGSVKDLRPDDNPWKDCEIYEKDKIFEGLVIKEAPFGFFIKLNTGAVSLLKKREALIFVVLSAIKLL